jgi:hypothetical protein
MKKFFGKYRGKVENNIDPLFLGRLQVSVPSVLGTDGLNWAMPCVPYAGPGVGLFLLPPNGANIWVEFEGGDPDYAVWTGCFWGIGEIPALPPVAGMKMLKTDSFTLTINEIVPGATIVSLETLGGATLSFNPVGVELSATTGNVAISGLQITLNDDALVVLP